MAVKAELELREILLTIGLVQPVKVESKSGSHVGAVCRLVNGQDKAWLRAIEHLLRIGADNDIQFHLGTRFVLKDGVMVKGWDVVIEAKSSTDLKRCLDIFKAAAQTIVELDPLPLPIESFAPIRPSVVTVPEDPVEEPTPAVPALTKAELDKRAVEYAKHTTAQPRGSAGMAEGDFPPPPPIEDTRPKIIFRSTAKDSRNRTVPVIVEEMVLPHYYPEDMNKPNERDRGATTTG
jgi:hypothetical protein